MSWCWFPSQNDNESETENNEAEPSQSASVLAPILGVGSRSFSSIPYPLQPYTKVAQKIVASYTLYKKPLMTVDETIALINKAWAKVQMQPRQVELVKVVENYVCEGSSDLWRRIADKQ